MYQSVNSRAGIRPEIFDLDVKDLNLITIVLEIADALDLYLEHLNRVVLMLSIFQILIYTFLLKYSSITLRTLNTLKIRDKATELS